MLSIMIFHVTFHTNFRQNNQTFLPPRLCRFHTQLFWKFLSGFEYIKKYHMQDIHHGVLLTNIEIEAYLEPNGTSKIELNFLEKKAPS